MPELFRIKQIERSEVARLRSENSLLRAALDLNKILLDDSIDEVVDLKFSLEEATGVSQN